MIQCSSCGGDCGRGGCKRENINPDNFIIYGSPDRYLADAKPVYWCLICQRPLPITDGVIVHDDVPHPDNFDFNEMENPQ